MASNPIATASKKLLRVAIVGIPNAGKSTLLNRLVNSEVSCVSKKVHTTRKNLLAAITIHDTQLEFLDSPGVVTRDHLIKHRLEDSLHKDPYEAANRSELIAAVVDVSNPRERRGLNRGIRKILHDHSDKTSLLIMNKIDLLERKKDLLDIEARLTEGHLENKPTMDKHELRSILGHSSKTLIRPTSKYVINLNPNDNKFNDPAKIDRGAGFRGFSRAFSISALNDDGVEDLKEVLLSMAKPVEQWPHGADYICNKRTADLVSDVIRGHVMDNTEAHIAYTTRCLIQECDFDELGSLHVHMNLVVPDRYMVGKLVGEKGAVIFKIINESRDKLSNLLACDVKLNVVASCDRPKTRSRNKNL